MVITAMIIISIYHQYHYSYISLGHESGDKILYKDLKWAEAKKNKTLNLS